MTPEGKRDIPDIALSDEAIDWLVLLKSGRASAQDRRDWEAWRSRSEAHELAASEAETIWNGVGVAGDQLRKGERRAKLSRRALLGGGIVAVGGAALFQSGMIGPHLFPDYATSVGKQRTVTLADGSTVFMNADTALSMDLTPSRRNVRLFRGQAMFDVSLDQARPFTVAANGGYAEAPGTVFDIDIRPSTVAVTVVEGTVDVGLERRGSDVVRTSADQRVIYGADGFVSGVQTIDVAAETAWRRGKLIFNQRALGDVVAEVQRYREGHILIVNSSLRQLEVTGVFEIADPDAILETLAATLPVRITRLPLVTVIR